MDSSALVKLILNEPESDALTGWLSERAETARLTSDLSKVEVIRVCRRTNETDLLAARQLLASLDYVPLTAGLLDQAGRIGPSLLRSLDAIDLASALSVRADLSAFVAYDRRLQSAAEDEHLNVVAPA